MNQPKWIDKGHEHFERVTDGGKSLWPDQRTAYTAGYREGFLEARKLAADVLTEFLKTQDHYKPSMAVDLIKALGEEVTS